MNGPSGPRSFLPGLLAVLAGTALLVGALRWQAPPIFCGDGWYHMRYAHILAHEGISRSFPWWQESFLRDRWADKDFLYHLLLIPFTLGDLLLGARLSTVVFASAAMGAFYAVARSLAVPLPTLWAAALLAFAPDFLFRLTFTRSWVVGLTLALAGTGAILLGRARAAGVCAALYANAHTSFHLLPCVALLHDLQRERIPEERLTVRFRTTLWTLGGMAAGLLLSPYVPNNLRLWWVQNVDVLTLSWWGPADLRLGTEFLPLDSRSLVVDNLGTFVALGGAAWLLSRAGRGSAHARTLLVMSFGWLALTLMSQRFIEFWAPFTMLLAGVAVRDHREHPRNAPAGWGVGGRPRWAPVWGWVAAALVAATLGVHNVRGVWAALSEEEEGVLAGAAQWLDAHATPGDKVFHLGWDEFPELFFFAPEQRYLVGLDPTFLYATDPERWRLWNDIATARVDDLAEPIRSTFRCRFVVAGAKYVSFLHEARRDPRFVADYEDPHASVFSLRGSGALVQRWRVTGWYPDPLRRLFDVPLGPEPGAGRAGDIPAWRETPAEIDVTAGPGFFDLDRAVSLPPRAKDACVVAQGTWASERAGPATLGLTTDDEVRLYVNGAPVLESSPYRSPAPGDPGGPPIDLGSLPRAGSHLPERVVQVLSRAGVNDVLVKTCRGGDDFGFFLRMVEPSTAPSSQEDPSTVTTP